MKKKLSTGPGIMLGIPTLGRPVPLDWALSFKSMNPPINFNVCFNLIRGKEVADARNAIAQSAIESDAKYLFFLGDDTVCPPHALRQLIYRMENNHNIGVVGGVYCSKSDPPAPLVFKDNGKGSYWDWKIGEFFEVSGLGMDCTLIRVDVLKELSSPWASPWFKTIDTDGFLDGQNSCESWTEDLFFLRRVVEETKYKVFCDASVICEHHDVYSGKIYRLPKDSLPMRQKGVIRSKKALVLGPKLELVDESFDITTGTQHDDPSADYRLDYSSLPFETEQFDFVVLSEVVENFAPILPELLRVARSGAKIAINLHPWFQPSTLEKMFGGTINGSFLEIVKVIPPDVNSSQ